MDLSGVWKYYLPKQGTIIWEIPQVLLYMCIVLIPPEEVI